ncbi:hypothetical protein N7478_007713 [Penicillium angulare]|uniref:uncharacterized protein n=1 Tax=Penicillium angulare TaxID=116970 RepID=UPI0025416500|nr:uncharacterized protein N7478_007713 [Penicillium angulare]KAJ5272588.1 hypothetical protein N7478_007713 [Penicillium angulare]
MTTAIEWLQTRHEILETEFANGPSTTNLNKAVSNSRLYRLPNELRVYIIRLAFGDRTIHTGHIVPDHLIETVHQHFTEPHNLRWRSCVCARPPDRSANDDNCGLFSCEHDLLSDRPKLESLVIMGFL